MQLNSTIKLNQHLSVPDSTNAQLYIMSAHEPSERCGPLRTHYVSEVMVPGPGAKATSIPNSCKESGVLT